MKSFDVLGVVCLFLTTCGFLLINYLYPAALTAEQADVVTKIHKYREQKYNVLTQCLGNSKLILNTTTLHGARLHNPESTESQSFRKVCNAGFVKTRGGECELCPEGKFSFPQWILCQPLLTCDHMLHNVKVSNFLYTVGNWKLYSAEWNSYDIIYAMSSVKKDDDENELNDFPQLLPHENILYPIGHCDQEMIGYASIDSFLGSALDLDAILSRQTGCDSWIVRFHIAIDYVRILTHLHESSYRGSRVLCNSHTLKDILSQFLITKDLRLVFVPTDNLPLVTEVDQNGPSMTKQDQNNLIKCSAEELKGDFIAPEQKWPFHDLKVFNFHQQPGYNEKTDIWKIPDVVKSFLNNDDNSGQVILNHLFVTHQRCKSLDPQSRPTASQVLQEYMSVWKLML